MTKPRDLAERFWDHVAVGGVDECWEWQSYRKPPGYGRIKVGGKVKSAHSVAHFLATGTWPEFICHRCDNPPCCNPAHLYPGTPAANARDRDQRYRGLSLLLPEQIAYVQSKTDWVWGEQMELAKRWAVPYGWIQSARRDSLDIRTLRPAYKRSGKPTGRPRGRPRKDIGQHTRP